MNEKFACAKNIKWFCKWQTKYEKCHSQMVIDLSSKLHINLLRYFLLCSFGESASLNIHSLATHAFSYKLHTVCSHEWFICSCSFDNFDLCWSQHLATIAVTTGRFHANNFWEIHYTLVRTNVSAFRAVNGRTLDSVVRRYAAHNCVMRSWKV